MLVGIALGPWVTVGTLLSSQYESPDPRITFPLVQLFRFFQLYFIIFRIQASC